MPNTLFGGASINSARGYTYILHLFLEIVKRKHDFVNIEVFPCSCDSTGNFGETNTQIDLISKESYNYLNQGIKGISLMKPQVNQPEAGQRLVQNIQANERFVKREYPNENFISDITQLQPKNKYSKGLIIPENVKIAESRIPINSEQRRTLRKELRQAGILSRQGNSVYLTPEPGMYKKRTTDAIVNGVPFEFRNITGKSRQVEQEFSDAKIKAKDANVFMNIDSDISSHEVWRRIVMVLDRHPDYTGKIVVSFRGKNPYFCDTGIFRQKKSLP